MFVEQLADVFLTWIINLNQNHGMNYIVS
ncbi:hypothetical protein JOF47_001368 [Paeniglutamicibacter kerguelensis]|uniref:Uncharacterized protein n=1 Tax=Paeniglutamicibacter kerguelensis TaxID=254788 RepID=A0ABS4XBK8_9MICC|nr:hypothetical protein [Paeniglutamicibacter kerguelensis]